MKSITEMHKPVSRPEKILQYGEGNFLRAFVDWMVDITNEKTSFNGNVVMVQPLDRGLADMINDQKGLYTTVLRGIQDGKAVEEFRTITSTSRCLNSYTQFDEYLKLASSPDLRFVVSNTTEAGIAYVAGDKLEDKPQSSFPGKVAAFLYNRFKAFNGDSSKGLIFIPCELIDKNGEKLKEYVLRYAEDWKLGADFTKWVNEACDFCNSLVDRIVPGYPRAEADGICERLGYKDNLLNSAEIFHLWVIETKNDYSKEFPLTEAGLNVVWTHDMSFYRTRKVRILNGTHTMSVPAGFQYGLDTVQECLKDEIMFKFIKKGLFDEFIPSMDGDKVLLVKYANEVLERFKNPYNPHQLLSITLNSVSKFKTRDLPSLLGYIEKLGKIPPVLSFSMASLISFYEATEIANGEMTGNRNGSPYPIKDDLHVLEFFAAQYKLGGDIKAKAARLTKAVLSNTEWWGEDLTRHAGLEDAVRAELESIWTLGMKAAITAFCN